jgi:PP-loop superfamily ATP-utilizing enzyme
LLNDNALEAIITGIKAAGYTYVTLDLEGYRMGSLNEKK